MNNKNITCYDWDNRILGGAGWRDWPKIINYWGRGEIRDGKCLSVGSSYIDVFDIGYVWSRNLFFR